MPVYGHGVLLMSYPLSFSFSPVTIDGKRPKVIKRLVSIPEGQALNTLNSNLTYLDTLKHIHISGLPAINQDLRERVLKALSASSRDQEAFDIAQCSRNFRIYKARQCGNRAVIPYYCGHRLCQVCARRRSARFYHRLKHIFDKMRRPKMLTLTVKNVPVIDRAYFKWIRGCLSKLRRRNCFKEVFGGVYSIETTYNASRGDWHVHIHGLIDSEYLLNRDLIKQAWEKITEGSWGVDIRMADKNAIREILKYECKLSDFADHPDRVDEYLKAVKGQRLFHGFGVCHNVKDDEETEEEVKKGFKCDCGGCSWDFETSLSQGDSYEDSGGFVWTWSMLKGIQDGS